VREIGRIKLVQVQQSSLKAGHDHNTYYDHTPLLVVDHILVAASGVVGVAVDENCIIDIHNANHPQSRNRGDNGLSIGFTSHYDSMRSRFGEHLEDGRAGENIIVETDTMYSLDDLGGGLVIQKAATGETIYFTIVEPITPCAPFSHYAAKNKEPLSSIQLKETLQFLHRGRRGFYIEPTNLRQEVSIRAGDALFALAPAEVL